MFELENSIDYLNPLLLFFFTIRSIYIYNDINIQEQHSPQKIQITIPTPKPLAPRSPLEKERLSTASQKLPPERRHDQQA